MFEWPRLAFFPLLLSLVFSSLGFLGSPLLAQATCEWSKGFHLDSFDGEILAAITFDDGTGPALYVGGRFEVIDDRLVSRVARWDGSRWQQVGDGLPGAVFAFEVYDDGSGPALYAGGFFETVGESDVGRIARWDGQEWRPLSSGPDHGIYDLEVYDDGTGEVLVAAGFFGSAGGVSAEKLAKWDGEDWHSFGIRLDGGGERITNLAVTGLGHLVIAGSFRYLNSVEMNNIALFGGSSWSSLSGGTNGTVNSLAVIGSGIDSRVYAGGVFTQAGGSTVNHVAAWDYLGWNGLGSGTDGSVHALEFLDLGDGPRLHAAGSFTEAGGGAARYVASWDGTSWQGLGSNMERGSCLLHVHDFGEGPSLLVGGDFTIPGEARNLAVLDGTEWRGFGHPGLGLDGEVKASVVFDDGSGPALYVVGNFSFGMAGPPSYNLARWQGSRWTLLDSSDMPSAPTAIEVFDDGNGPALYVSGYFASSGPGSIQGVAKWDGSEWTKLGEGISGTVLAMEILDDGSGPALYIGGDFSLVGLSGQDVAKWDGESWTAFGSGTPGRIWALAVFDDGEGPKLHAAGEFERIDGVTAHQVARWTGSTWEALTTGELTAATIYTLEVFDDGSGPALYAGGDLLVYISTEIFISLGKVARWDGVQWADLSPNIQYRVVRDLEIFDDGSGPALYATGEFEKASEEIVNHVAKWDGSRWQPLGSGPDVGLGEGDGNTLAVFDDGIASSLFVGGSMERAGGHVSSKIARYGCFQPPSLGIEAPSTAELGERFEVAVHFDHGGRGLASTTFSLDYDEGCLDPDVDGDGELDGLTISVAGDFEPSVLYDPGAGHGEIAVTFDDATSPIALLPEGEVLRLTFEAVCVPESADFVDAGIRFATDPAPTFGTDLGQSAAGELADGAVRIWADWLLFADGFELGTTEGWDEVVLGGR